MPLGGHVRRWHDEDEAVGAIGGPTEVDEVKEISDRMGRFTAQEWRDHAAR